MRTTILLLLTLLLSTLAACTEPPPEVGRATSDLSYTDGGAPILETAAETIAAWKEETGCKATISEWRNFAKGDDWIAYEEEYGVGTSSEMSTVRTCRRTHIVGVAEYDYFCDHCCTTVTVCLPGVGCHSNTSCTDTNCRQVNMWPPP